MRLTRLKALEVTRNDVGTCKEKRRADRRVTDRYVGARKGLNEVDTYIKTLKGLGKERK